jgi:hypothetical protein
MLAAPNKPKQTYLEARNRSNRSIDGLEDIPLCGMEVQSTPVWFRRKQRWACMKNQRKQPKSQTAESHGRREEKKRLSLH